MANESSFQIFLGLQEGTLDVSSGGSPNHSRAGSLCAISLGAGDEQLL